jgi:hypothetical protein
MVFAASCGYPSDPRLCRKSKLAAYGVDGGLGGVPGPDGGPFGEGCEGGD